MDLFIPTRINKDDKYGKGIGKAEMRRIVIGTLCGFAVGGAAAFIFVKDNLQNAIVIMIAVGGVIGIITYFICLKNSINLSGYHYIKIIIEFFKRQQHFLYKKRREWF